MVFTIVKDYVEKNNPSFEDLQKAFPDEVQGSKGFIRKESEVKDPKRFNMREPLKIKNGSHVVVSNQWGGNINDFIAASEKLGYVIIINSAQSKTDSNETPKMKLPKQYFPDYKLDWGKYITFKLENGPSCHSIDHFSINLNMETNEVIGRPNRDNALSRWFGSWEVDIYDGYEIERSYDGNLRIWGKDDSQEWCIICHGAFEDLDEGVLPEGVTGDDIWNALGDGEAIYEMYYHIKTYGD